MARTAGLIGSGLAAIVMAAAIAGSVTAQAQGNGGPIWDGVYAAAQAARGKVAYDVSCGRCHGSDLTGSTAPALKGGPFMQNWEGQTLDRLFAKIRDTMPPSNPAGVGTEAKMDLIAYLLQANGFPAGERALSAAVDALVRDRELQSIQIVRQGRAGQEPADFSLVRVVGCLATIDGSAWMLTGGTSPVTATDQPVTADRTREAAALPPGSRSFHLVSVYQFTPASHVGHRVDVTGLISNEGGESRLNVVSLRPVGQACSG